PSRLPLFPYTTLFRSLQVFELLRQIRRSVRGAPIHLQSDPTNTQLELGRNLLLREPIEILEAYHFPRQIHSVHALEPFFQKFFADRKSTRLNSSHVKI